MAPSRSYPRAERRPLVFGHRGASYRAPENTLAAFRLAMEEGADGFELDVWRCGSGEVVVVHDEDLRRVGHSPLEVQKATLSELQSVDVGRFKAPEYAGERVPTLDQVLEATPGAWVNVELKGEGLDDRGLVREVVRIVRERKAEDRVILSSFNPAYLFRLKALSADLPFALLLEKESSWWRRRALRPLLQPQALHLDRALVDEARVGALWHKGCLVGAWTVDDPEEVRQHCHLGIAAIFTNRPGEIREVVRQATGH